jgi:hypothetical protein
MYLQFSKNVCSAGLKLGLLLACFAVSGCSLFLTDGATRLAGEIGRAADQLRQSSATSLETQHRPVRFPDGVKGRYEIILQASINRPRGGALLVGDLDSRGYQNWGYNWGTTFHLRQVRVPVELSIRKDAHQTTTIVLTRAPDGVIEVTALR